MRWYLSCLLLGITLALPRTAAATFPLPERLEFNVYFMGIYAGKAVQEITATGNQLQVVSTAVSAAWLNWMYKVDDRTVATVETSPAAFVGRPIRYHEKIYEGRPRYDKEILFDFQKLKATINDRKENNVSTHDITPRTYDSLSSFTAIRAMKLDVGKSAVIDVFDGKRLHPTEVQVLKRERIKVKAGEFSTVKVRPLLKTKGIFEKTGDVFIWLTDDDRHIPVKMTSEVVIGAITAELVAIK